MELVDEICKPGIQVATLSGDGLAFHTELKKFRTQVDIVHMISGTQVAQMPNPMYKVAGIIQQGQPELTTAVLVSATIFFKVKPTEGKNG